MCWVDLRTWSEFNTELLEQSTNYVMYEALVCPCQLCSTYVPPPATRTAPLKTPWCSLTDSLSSTLLGMQVRMSRLETKTFHQYGLGKAQKRP